MSKKCCPPGVVTYEHLGNAFLVLMSVGVFCVVPACISHDLGKDVGRSSAIKEATACSEQSTDSHFYYLNSYGSCTYKSWYSVRGR